MAVMASPENLLLTTLWGHHGVCLGAAAMRMEEDDPASSVQRPHPQGVTSAEGNKLEHKLDCLSPRYQLSIQAPGSQALTRAVAFCGFFDTSVSVDSV